MNNIYSTRSSRAWCLLNNAHFDAANHDNGMGTLMFLGGGCLDAPEQIPAGSVKGYGKKHGYSLPTVFPRSDLELTVRQIAEREALAERLISEMLAEERVKGL